MSTDVSIAMHCPLFTLIREQGHSDCSAEEAEAGRNTFAGIKDSWGILFALLTHSSILDGPNIFRELEFDPRIFHSAYSRCSGSFRERFQSSRMKSSF